MSKQKQKRFFCAHAQHVLDMFCFCFDIQNNFCTQHVLDMFGIFLNNLSPYFGSTDSRMSASDTDLPVQFFL